MHMQTFTRVLHTVSIRVKSRVVTVTGPRGSLSKSFRHMDMELTKVGKNKLRVDIWFAKRKQLACLQTICGHIKNMFKGVLYVSVITQCSLSAGICVVNKGVPPPSPIPQTFNAIMTAVLTSSYYSLHIVGADVLMLLCHTLLVMNN